MQKKTVKDISEIRYHLIRLAVGVARGFPNERQGSFSHI